MNKCYLHGCGWIAHYPPDFGVNRCLFTRQPGGYISSCYKPYSPSRRVNSLVLYFFPFHFIRWQVYYNRQVMLYLCGTWSYFCYWEFMSMYQNTSDLSMFLSLDIWFWYFGHLLIGSVWVHKFLKELGADRWDRWAKTEAPERKDSAFRRAHRPELELTPIPLRNLMFKSRRSTTRPRGSFIRSIIPS